MAGGGFKQQESVIFHGHLPEEAGRAPGDAREVAQEPARQVDQVDALVEQLAAARNGRIRAPLALIAGAAAVAVASADKQQGADRAGIEDGARLLEGAVISMIEAN